MKNIKYVRCIALQNNVFLKLNKIYKVEKETINSYYLKIKWSECVSESIIDYDKRLFTSYTPLKIKYKFILNNL